MRLSKRINPDTGRFKRGSEFSRIYAVIVKVVTSVFRKVLIPSMNISEVVSPIYRVFQKMDLSEYDTDFE